MKVTTQTKLMHSILASSLSLPNISQLEMQFGDAFKTLRKELMDALKDVETREWIAYMLLILGTSMSNDYVCWSWNSISFCVKSFHVSQPFNKSTVKSLSYPQKQQSTCIHSSYTQLYISFILKVVYPPLMSLYSIGTLWRKSR